MNLAENVERILERGADDWSAEDRARAGEIAREYADLLARAIRGEEVGAQLDTVREEAHSLAPDASLNGDRVFRAAIEGLIESLVRRALPECDVASMMR
jgi:hypothetical protein